MLATVVYWLAGPGGGEDLQGLIEHLTPQTVIELLTGGGQLAGEVVAAQADLEGETAAARVIHGSAT
jgi:hypothetical protein